MIPNTTRDALTDGVSDMFSVWTALVRPLIRNLREGTPATDHKRLVPLWVQTPRYREER